MNTAFWIHKMAPDGLSSSWLSMRLTSSGITRQAKLVGIYFWSCVGFSNNSTTRQYFRCFFRQPDISNNSPHIFVLTLQLGPENPTTIPWVRLPKSVSTTSHTQH